MGNEAGKSTGGLTGHRKTNLLLQSKCMLLSVLLGFFQNMGNACAPNSCLSVLEHAWWEGRGSDLRALCKRALFEISCVFQDVCMLFLVPPKQFRFY